MISLASSIILLTLSLIDWGLTYWILNHYIVVLKKKEKKVIEIEANVIARFLMHRLGFHKGIIISYIVSLIIIITAIYYSQYSYFYFMLGAYMVILMTHIQHVRILRKEDKKKKNRGKKK